MGVCGITAAMYQDSEVVMTDYLESVLDVLKENSRLNQNHYLKKVHIRKLDWFDYVVDGTYDFIIGSELIYSQTPLEKLANLVKEFLNKNGEFWLLMPEERMYGNQFLGLMQDLGFVHEIIILEDEYYTCSPLEDIALGESSFYPLKELRFRLHVFRLTDMD